MLVGLLGAGRGRTLVLLACVCFLNPVLFQPMAWLGFSAFLEGLNPSPIKAPNERPVVTILVAFSGNISRAQEGDCPKIQPMLYASTLEQRCSSILITSPPQSHAILSSYLKFQNKFNPITLKSNPQSNRTTCQPVHTHYNSNIPVRKEETKCHL